MTPTLTTAILIAAAVVIVLLLVTVLAFRSALRIERDRTASWKKTAQVGQVKRGVLLALTRERDEARAKLAKFTAPRKRDALGHFVKDAG